LRGRKSYTSVAKAGLAILFLARVKPCPSSRNPFPGRSQKCVQSAFEGLRELERQTSG
jgi:hypothetical protein